MAIYELAGLLVEMDPQYPTMQTNSAPYRSAAQGEPDIRIRPGPSYIAEMQALNPALTPDQCEYYRFASLFYRGLLRFQGMMLHASAVVLDGRAYLFSAPPGTGKSTHTAGWLSRFRDRAYILNDDKPALRFQGDRLLACGTPFSGAVNLSRNTSAPVAGICMLERGEENRIAPLPPGHPDGGRPAAGNAVPGHRSRSPVADAVPGGESGGGYGLPGDV